MLIILYWPFITPLPKIFKHLKRKQYIVTDGMVANVSTSQNHNALVSGACQLSPGPICLRFFLCRGAAAAPPPGCDVTTATLWYRISAYLDSRCCQRPYHAENTSSRPITEVKQHRARLVLGWVTAWEHRVSLTFCSLPRTLNK